MMIINTEPKTRNMPYILAIQDAVSPGADFNARKQICSEGYVGDGDGVYGYPYGGAPLPKCSLRPKGH